MIDLNSSCAQPRRGCKSIEEERERESDKARSRETERERQTDRQTDRERDRERGRGGERRQENFAVCLGPGRVFGALSRAFGITYAH